MKAVLLNSGGKDSRVAAAIVRSYDEPVELHSLFVDYNHHDGREAAEAAEETARMYCASHREWSFPEDWMITKESGVWGIPFKALFVMTLGAMYAHTIGADAIVAGFDKGLGGKPQRYIQQALNELRGRNGPLLIWTPLEDERQVVEMAEQMGVDLTGTSKSQ